MRELRDALRRVLSEVGRKSDDYSRDDVIASFRREKAELVRLYSDDLLKVALKRILNDVESKQTRRFDFSQIEMFPELARFPLSLPAAVGSPRGSRRFLRRMSIREIRRFLERSQPVKEQIEKHSELKDFLEEAEQAGCIDTDDASLEDVIAKWQEVRN